MAAYTKMIQDSRTRRSRLMDSIQSHRQSIAEIEREVRQLDGVISSLEKLSKSPTGPGREVRAPKTTARRRGTWKPGSRGRPPQWYLEQQRARGRKPAKKAAKAKRKKKVSPKVLAALAKAREARAAKRSATKGAAQ